MMMGVRGETGLNTNCISLKDSGKGEAYLNGIVAILRHLEEGIFDRAEGPVLPVTPIGQKHDSRHLVIVSQVASRASQHSYYFCVLAFHSFLGVTG